MEGASKVTLYAIDGRGYAESVRLCLAACRVAYEEVAVTTRAQLDALPTPLPKQLPLLVVEFEGARPAEGGDYPYLRSERQCVLRLPETRACVFSIHTYVMAR